MAARQIIVPGAMPSRDANGRPLPARLRFYLPDTDTPATVYADADLSVPQAFPILSDSAGRWPQIWADDAQLFDVGWSALADDAFIAAFEDVSPVSSALSASAILAQSAADAAGASASSAASSAAAAALSLADTEAFVADFGDISGAVTAALASAADAESSAGSAAGSATSAAASAASAANIGRHALWIPAAGMQARNTNGASAGVIETSSNKVMQRSLDFDASTIEYAQFGVVMPKAWNEGTVTFQTVWSHASTSTNFKVSWGLQAVAISDTDAGDAALGTAQYSNDTGGATNAIYKSPESAAITVAGAPQPEDLVMFQVLRKADDATNDTLAIDARLLGIVVYITTDRGNDA